ncbi:unnamed protein product [Blepharisma stoltei]|uniref:LisH domain-containing protein ARMC9 n=1 Tax=Blepharisma stoltei TaxID=1481888 RepID=A0AAU9KAF8_9CILI|nr:unnamed protein product [Blepharisma stoltei]
MKAQGKQGNSGENLLQVIHEYLLKSGFLNTLEVFQHEMTAARNKSEDSQALSLIIKSLDTGDKDSFFRLWSRFVPLNASKSTEGQKLDFYAHVYFSVFPIHPLNRQKKDDGNEYKNRMESFKEFLNTKGAELSKTEEFLHFYALPYIPNPAEHPSFKILFTRGWATELKERVSKFYKAHSGQNQEPLLVQMYKAYNQDKGKRVQPRGKTGRESNAAFEELEAQFAVAKQELEDLNNQYIILQKREEYARNTLLESQTKWTNFSKDILNMTKELYRVVEACKRGQNPNQSLLEAIFDKIVRYDNFLNISNDELSGGASFSYSQADHSNSDFTPSPRRADVSESSLAPMRSEKPMVKGYANLPQLNYAIVIRDLSSLQDDLQVCALLQALRWRLSRSQSLLRKEMLSAYIKYNILCTAKPHDILLDKLLSWNKRVKEYTVRFLNVIASECSGRTYLLTKENVIEILSAILFEEKEDSILRQNALGTLQKLSLRRQAQSTMIELNMIDWLARLLKHEVDSISYYSLEYATALLMNLSLRTAGKNNIEKSQLDIIAILNNLLEHENTQVRTYVNGTLYSILTRKKLKEHALQLGMEDALKYLMQNSDEHFKRQIQYILDQLYNEQEEDCLSDDNDDDVEDRDEEESEIDDFIAEDEDMDDIIKESGVLVGEDLLNAKYMAKMGGNSSKVNLNDPGKPPSRPVTPAQPADKKVPTEMKSKPKIPRTPDTGVREPVKIEEQKVPEQKKQIPQQNSPQQPTAQQPTPQPPKEAPAKAEPALMTPQGTGEFTYAFVSRDKIPRSPL